MVLYEQQTKLSSAETQGLWGNLHLELKELGNIVQVGLVFKAQQMQGWGVTEKH